MLRKNPAKDPLEEAAALFDKEAIRRAEAERRKEREESHARLTDLWKKAGER